MEKVGLVLEGGGMRGAYTAGVLSWLLDQGLYADYCVGISSGGMYGAFYAADQNDLLFEGSVNIAPNPDYVGMKPILKEGQLIAYDEIYDRKIFEAGFDPKRLVHSKTDLEIGVYSLDTYETLWKTNEDIANQPRWIKAATALPFFGKFVKINGTKYTDGGVTTMIPIRRSLEVGCKKHIVVTTKSPDYVRPPFKKLSIWLLKHVRYPFHKPMVDDFAQRTDVYYQERDLVDELVQQGNCIYLYPTQETGVTRYKGSHDQFVKLFEMAKKDCERQKEALFAYLKP